VIFSMVIGLAAECAFAAPVLIFGTAAVERAPWLNALQSPAGMIIERLLRYAAVRDMAGRLPEGVLFTAQCSVVLLQTAIFSIAVFVLSYLYGAIQGAFRPSAKGKA
jgi:hypothetical protein